EGEQLPASPELTTTQAPILEAQLKVKQVEAAKASGNGHTTRIAPEVLSTSGDQIQFKIAARERPSAMAGITYKMNTAYGHLYVTVNEDKYGPFEVFASLGKTGGFFSAQTEAITRLISLALRSNVATEEIISQLKGIRGPDVSFADGEMIFSLPDAIGRILEKHAKRGQDQLKLNLDLPSDYASKKSGASTASSEANLLIAKDTDRAELTIADISPATVEKVVETVVASQKTVKKTSLANLGSNPICPSCSTMMIFQEGCAKCEMCGYSKCG
ncbi:MAG TPA: hypothetical protein VEA59_05895, partial [Patescibacteria group bacterium]|nr:hypothetical protein [Patescibacteria group bacterium]